MNDKEARELTENIESLPDYEKIWMTLGNLTSSIEGLAELQQSQAETIQRILNNFGRFDADLRAHRQRVANLEQDRKGMMARIKDLEDDLHEEWSRMKPAIKAVEALIELLPHNNYCDYAENCEYR